MNLTLRAIPYWLDQALTSSGSNLNVVTSIPKLVDILSIDDVSFYIALNMSIGRHMPANFMESFSRISFDLSDDPELGKAVEGCLIQNRDFKDRKAFIDAQYHADASGASDKQTLLGFQVIKIIDDTVLLRFVAMETDEEVIDAYKNLLSELSKHYPIEVICGLPLFNNYEALLNKTAFAQLVER